uniref:Uncharacterized protein n=1 Tax=Oreochromis niloticus TaxID=8128 RepID=A0A669EK52_ORENI
MIIIYLMQHKEASVEMFEHLVKTNNLEEEMKQYRLNMTTDLTFIKEMIKPLKSDDTKVLWPYEGRGENKSFLYEIVSNKQNGIDVDKFDYFARDCHHLGIRNNFDHQRFIMFARVCDVNGRKHICSRDKEVANLYDMFHTRISLHRRAYKHRVTQSVEMMIKDALVEANRHIEIVGSKGEKFQLSTAKTDMKAYTKLTDQVVEEISKSTDDNLKGAKEILQRISDRKLYWCVGQANPVSKAFMCLHYKSTINSLTVFQVNFHIFIFPVVSLDYGMKDEDPINKTYFYSKEKPDEAFTIPISEVSKLLPECFSEVFIRVYMKNFKTETEKNKAKKCFREWCKEVDYEIPKMDDDDDPSSGTSAIQVVS